MEKFIISLDQGTTSSRALLINKNGDAIYSNQMEFGQIYPKNSWVEQDPLEIFETQLNTLKNCIDTNSLIKGQVVSVGITNQRETTILWNRITGEPVCNALVWQCKRSQNITTELKKQGYQDLIHKKTGLILDPYFSGTKIKWVFDNVKGVKEMALRGELLFGTVDTWLLWKFTKGKKHATDVSNASRTMLFNIIEKKWDDEILELLEIPKSILPEVLPTSSSFGLIDSSYFGYEIPINCLIGDQQSALFGQLCTNVGDIKNTYGTGCFTLMNIGDRPIFSKNGLLTTIAWEIGNICCYAVEGSVFIAGAIIQWLRDELGLLKTAEESEDLALSVPDTNGVTFISTFQGIGTPYWNSETRGEITGLTRSSKKAHIVRAALESIAFRSMEVINTMKNDSGISINSIKVDGGACKNNFLMQFQSDISNVDIIRPSNVESTALGAAYIAGLFSGFWKDLDEIKKIKKSDKLFKPLITSEKREDLINQWTNALNKALGDA